MGRDRVDDVSDLMNRVRAHYENLEQSDAPASTQDGFQRHRDPVRSVPDGPAHRMVDVAEAYSYNLVAAQYATVEAFGRKRQAKRTMVASSDQVGLRRQPPQTRYGQAALPPPTNKGARNVPQWARQEIAYERAIALIEQRGREAFVKATTRRAAAASATPGSPDDSATPVTNQPQTTTAKVTSGRNPNDIFEGPFAPEVTDPNFQYLPGESAFEQLAAGAKVESGRGADFIDPEGTQTMVFAFGRPPVA